MTEMKGNKYLSKFIINKDLRGWHYGWIASKHHQDIYHVFMVVLLQSIGNNQYKVIKKIVSPKFQIRCSRRIPTSIASRNTPKAFKRNVNDDLLINDNSYIPLPEKCLYDGSNRNTENSPKYYSKNKKLKIHIQDIEPQALYDGPRFSLSNEEYKYVPLPPFDDKDDNMNESSVEHQQFDLSPKFDTTIDNNQDYFTPCPFTPLSSSTHTLSVNEFYSHL